MSKHKITRSKHPATFVPTYCRVIRDYIKERNYGIVEDLIEELMLDLGKTDWREFNEWRRERRERKSK